MEKGFLFRAHRPSAYWQFAVFLTLLIIVNLVVIAFFYQQLKPANETILRTVILIVPWLLLLILPSIVAGILIYRSFVKTYRFIPQEKELIIELTRKNSSTAWKKNHSWEELKNVRIIDFEDNHYCRLEFRDSKNDLIIHRDGSDFAEFMKKISEHHKLDESIWEVLSEDSGQ